MNFKGEAIRATEASIAVIATELGVPYFRLRGVIEVEAPKGPFDRQGRPTMLFEPHKFYEFTSGARRERAVTAGLAWPKWRRDYPPDSYPRLTRAMEIDEVAALKSCSWGRGQVMGFNHKAAGYPTVHAMVEAFKRSESEQLRGMAAYIKSMGLVGALKSGNAHAFAKGYNGKSYAEHRYHTRIAAAWAKWKGRPAPEAAGEVSDTAAPPVTVAVTKEGAAAGAIGGLASLQAANEVAKTAKETGDSVSGFMTLLADPRFLILLAVVGAAALIWYWRRRRIAEEGI